MILGYHYHVSVLLKDGGIWVPSYIGVFLNAMADEVKELKLFLHEEPDPIAGGYDFQLIRDNIRFCSMGKKTPAWDRLLFPSRYLKAMEQEVLNCDALLLRSPSPLSPAIFTAFHKRVKTALLLVGDYADGAKHLVQPWYRLLVISVLLKRNDRQLKALLGRARVFVNSFALKEKYRNLNPEIDVIITSSLSLNDFYERENTCLNEEVKLLYTGRLDLAKGLKEILHAIKELSVGGYNVSMHFVAWEDDPAKPVEHQLLNLGEFLGIAERLHFHSKKAIGKPLNNMYRMADIYLIPSYHEGFPRTIWEAMANSLPVIATPVGGIPYLLNDKQDLLFTEPANATDLTNKIKQMIAQPALRHTLIQNGRNKAKKATLEVQVGRLIQCFKK
jgi:glycosyltransferase involved in cell wall biosynthesis